METCGPVPFPLLLRIADFWLDRKVPLKKVRRRGAPPDLKEDGYLAQPRQRWTALCQLAMSRSRSCWSIWGS